MKLRTYILLLCVYFVFFLSKSSACSTTRDATFCSDDSQPSIVTGTINNACWICDVFEDVVSGIGNIFTGGLWKDNWGYYNEVGHQMNGPYTVFDNRPGQNIYESQIIPLRKAIFTDVVFDSIYRKIYNQANEPLISYCSEEKAFCQVAKTAKTAAIGGEEWKLIP